MKGTSLKALLGECAELPLSLRRKKIMILYLLKIAKNDRNLAHLVLEDKKFYQLELKCKSVYKLKLNNFLEENNIRLIHPTINYKISPWFDLPDYVDLGYMQIFHKPIQDHLMIDEVLLKLSSNYNFIFFVDGSVQANLEVAA